MQDARPAAAPVARHRPAGDSRQLDPDSGSAAIAAGFVALCSYDRVPLPNAEPTDKLGVGHGGLLRLLVGFATSSVSDLACPPNPAYPLASAVIPEIPDEPKFCHDRAPTRVPEVPLRRSYFPFAFFGGGGGC